MPPHIPCNHFSKHKQYNTLTSEESTTTTRPAGTDPANTPSTILEDGGGHAVLLTGYEYDQENECYKLQIYDENRVHSGNIIGNFSYMTIPKDFSSFEYTDAVGEVISSDNFSELWLQDINLWNADILKTKKLQKVQKTVDASSNNTTLLFKKGSQVSIKDSLGQDISSNGKKFSGDMGIHDAKYIFNDDKYLFDVDKAEKYIVDGDGVTIRGTN